MFLLSLRGSIFDRASCDSCNILVDAFWIYSKMMLCYHTHTLHSYLLPYLRIISSNIKLHFEIREKSVGFLLLKSLLINVTCIIVVPNSKMIFSALTCHSEPPSMVTEATEHSPVLWFYRTLARKLLHIHEQSDYSEN